MPIPDSTDPVDVIHNARLDAEQRAIDNLARYKFSNFGYWAGAWVHYNQLLTAIDKTLKQPSPFKGFVHLAREVRDA